MLSKPITKKQPEKRHHEENQQQIQPRVFSGLAINSARKHINIHKALSLEESCLTPELTGRGEQYPIQSQQRMMKAIQSALRLNELLDRHLIALSKFRFGFLSFTTQALTVLLMRSVSNARINRAESICE
jgi:hypothetical protein